MSKMEIRANDASVSPDSSQYDSLNPKTPENEALPLELICQTCLGMCIYVVLFIGLMNAFQLFMKMAFNFQSLWNNSIFILIWIFASCKFIDGKGLDYITRKKMSPKSAAVAVGRVLLIHSGFIVGGLIYFVSMLLVFIYISKSFL